MKYIYFTPGPSQLYPTVKKHILQALRDDIPSLSHRSEKFHDIVEHVYKSLRKLLAVPEEYSIFFTASATEAMERVIENCAGNYSYHFVNGTFANRFEQLAVDLKKHPAHAVASFGNGYDFQKIRIPKKTELICLTQNETSSGIAIPPEDIHKISEYNPDSLIAVDIVSSVPYVNLKYEKLDCVFFSVQKGFGLPAGLGILIVSPRALRKSVQLVKQGYNVGSYHKFEILRKHADKYQTIETPNVLSIYLLGKVLSDMLTVGINTLREKTEEKAKFIYTYFDNHRGYKPFVHDRYFRSKTVLVIGTPGGSAALLGKLRKKGFVVGSGYGDMKEKQIRIANFPAHTMEDMKRLVKAIQVV